MSQPFYMGDLTGSPALEQTIDAITNHAIDGATDFLLGPGQLAHYAEFHGIGSQDEKRFWFRLAPGEALPETRFQGLVTETHEALRIHAETPAALDGLRLVLIPDGADLAAAACTLREAGVAEILVEARAKSPGELVPRALELRRETGLPLHVHLDGTPETLEEGALALGLLLENGSVEGLSLAGAEDRPGHGFARSLFNALELKRFGLNYVSCPTCGRCRVDLEAITQEVKDRTADITTPMTVAIMGCEVNGPGEARHADLGIAAGTESGLLIENGEAVAKFTEKELVDVLVERIRARVASEEGEAMEV